jgi:S-DNA-T family DNA segregation ATPase FtsK/SpoIIIE
MRLWELIQMHYGGFNVVIELISIQIICGLHRYIYDVKIGQGIHVQSVFDIAKDVQIALGLPLFYPFMEGLSIRIAVSEYEIRTNELLKILRSPIFAASSMKLPLALGYDITGNIYLTDLVDLRHLLIAGPSGSGKSVALRCIILSIIVKRPVSEVNILLFDIGANSLSLFDDISHLSYPIVKDTATAAYVMEALVKEMERRIALGENECQSLPYLVCLVDEFDSIASGIKNKRDNQNFIISMNELLRKGRKAKVIMVLATHDPTLKNCKVNINEIVARIAFRCTKHHNSTAVLGESGAEKLPGGGALLFKSPAQSESKFLQGSFIKPEEITRVLDSKPTDCDESNKFVIDEYTPLYQQPETAKTSDSESSVTIIDQEFADIIMWSLGRKKFSTNQISKQFHIGNRASNIADLLYHLGIISKKFVNQPRSIIPKSLEELSPEVIRILTHHGYSNEQVSDAFNVEEELQPAENGGTE